MKKHRQETENPQLVRFRLERIQTSCQESPHLLLPLQKKAWRDSGLWVREQGLDLSETSSSTYKPFLPLNLQLELKRQQGQLILTSLCVFFMLWQST